MLKIKLDTFVKNLLLKFDYLEVQEVLFENQKYPHQHRKQRYKMDFSPNWIYWVLNFVVCTDRVQTIIFSSVLEDGI